MTTAELIGEVASYVSGDPPEGLVLHALNNAGRALLVDIRDAWSERALVTETQPIIVDKDIYDLPRACESPARAKRFLASGVAVPLVRLGQADDDVLLTGALSIDAGYGHHGSNYQYVFLAGLRTFRLIQMPTETLDPGLSVTYYPRWLPLRNLEDKPVLAEALHEILTLRATVGMAARGASLANAQAFQQQLSAQEETLKRFLYPPDNEAGQQISQEFCWFDEQL
jgi:hypothetical protein